MRRFVCFILLIALSLIVCIATFVLLTGGQAWGIITNFAMSFPACLILCIVYYYIIQRLSRMQMFARHTALRILSDWLCATIIGCTASAMMRLAIGADDDWRTTTMTFILWNSMAVLGIEIYVYHRSMIEKEKQLARIEKEKAAYQFEALKQQLNPHFLFNSLNALASLAYQDAEKTNLFAKKLSAVYRYLLQTADKQLVTLREELQFLDAYLYLEQIRFGSAMQVSIDIPKEKQMEKIVPASLQLLVENALKHNIATESQPLRISITMQGDRIMVKNRVQPRGDVVSNKMGLKNLATQFRACGREIQIERSDDFFTVALPIFTE